MSCKNEFLTLMDLKKACMNCSKKVFKKERENV